MSRTGPGLTALVCLWAAVATSPAGASVITVAFSGSIVEVQDPMQTGDGSIVVGTPVSGSFTIDTTTPENSNPDHRGFAFFVPGRDGIPFEFSARFGQQSFLVNLPLNSMALGPRASFDVFDGLPFDPNGADVDQFQFGAAFASGGFQAFEEQATVVRLLLSAPGGRAISSTSLARIPFDLAAFPDAQLTLFRGDSGFFARGRIDRLTVAPEPGAAGLLAFGLALLARRRR